MSEFHIEIREPELATQGWSRLTPDEERQFLHELLDAIREANELGDPKPVEDSIARWSAWGIRSEKGTPEERRARGEEALRPRSR